MLPYQLINCLSYHWYLLRKEMCWEQWERCNVSLTLPSLFLSEYSEIFPFLALREQELSWDNGVGKRVTRLENLFF